jgi:Winged helix-turn-helix domain (DUF2582)
MQAKELQNRGATMFDEIGDSAGAIWHALKDNGEMTLSQLKKEVKGKTPIFDWSVGWLAREGKIIIELDKRSFRVRLSHGG